jgi:hypothetical protein
LEELRKQQKEREEEERKEQEAKEKQRQEEERKIVCISLFEFQFLISPLSYSNSFCTCAKTGRRTRTNSG